MTALNVCVSAQLVTLFYSFVEFFFMIFRLSTSGSQSLMAVPQDNRLVRLYDFNGVRHGRLPKISKVRQSFTHFLASSMVSSASFKLY